MTTYKELEAENPEAPGGNKHCLQCGWTYPIPGHAPGCKLANTKTELPAEAPYPKPAKKDKEA